MSSLASTLRSASPKEAPLDFSTQFCGVRAEPPNPNVPMSSEPPSPSPSPSSLKDFEYVGFILGYPADLVILTRDESERWFAHREILRFTKSQELQEQLSYYPGPTVYLDLPGGAVRTLLEWIYPHTSMHITTFDALDSAFFVSIVYKLDAMRDSLRALFDQPDCPVRIRADPVRAYSIASRYGLSSDAQEAAKLAIGTAELTGPGALEKMARKGVSVECAFRLMQRQLAWENALANILLKMPIEAIDDWSTELPMWVTEEELRLMACGECADRATAGDLVRMVDWQRKWTTQLHGRLVCTPLEKCNSMFQVECAVRMLGVGCQQCMVRAMRNPLAVEKWMKNMRKPLQDSWRQIFDAV